MPRYSWFKVFRSLGLEFWLLLPVLGLLGWSGSGLIMDWVMSSFSDPDKPLLIDAQEAKIKVLSIQATIIPQQGVSRIKVNTTHSKLRVLEFEFSAMQPAQIEAEISRELGLPLATVRAKIKYQIVLSD